MRSPILSGAMSHRGLLTEYPVARLSPMIGSLGPRLWAFHVGLAYAQSLARARCTAILLLPLLAAQPLARARCTAILPRPLFGGRALLQEET